MTTRATVKRSGRGPRQRRESPQNAALRRDLGLAIGARADDCARLTEARLLSMQWVGGANLAYLARRPGVIWFSTLLVARWLATGVAPDAEDLHWISERGQRAAQEQVSVINLVRANLAWRDTLVAIVREEASHLHAPRSVVEATIRAVGYNCDSGIMRTLGAFDARLADVAGQLAAERMTLRHQALHDPLTGVANRALLMDSLRATLSRLGVGHCAVLLLDLDDFKDVNDELGHEAGDALLVHVCDRIRAAIRPTDTLARLGGDELCVVLDHVTQADQARTAADRIAAAFHEPFSLSRGMRVSIGASIGVAMGTASDTADSVLRKADIAMYSAKASGKGCITLYEEGLEQSFHARLYHLSALRAAIESDCTEFELWYQPIVDVRDERVIVAVEALLRWRHNGRLIMPAEFITLAEEARMMPRLGRWVLSHACAQVSQWRSQTGHSELRVCVNASPVELEDDAYADQVAAALSRSGLDPSALTIEVTESVIGASNAGIARTLSALAAMNVQLAIDDFGTGNSSLNQLVRLPFTTVKIDRSLVEALDDARARSAVVLQALVLMGAALQIEVVAEGVETDAQLGHLREAHVLLCQGYLTGRPMDSVATERVLHRAHPVRPRLVAAS
jgi:diguanylate cyclase (GGDEF)-like protein